ncbi:MAG: serine/threonine-protein kinase [Fimbriiglobus sp.]|nr:serine/threonine-protein kinase [Fimbriiglobus sp.]
MFLARQPEMGSRAVVLKVGQLLSAECQKLAKLQHPNVVPVYSFHQSGRFQAVCMPYRGPLTLAHLVSRLQTEHLPTLNGRALTTVIADCRRTRTVELPADAAVSADTDTQTTDGPLLRIRGLTFLDAVLTLVRQVAEGLRFSHAEGIVHSDLKPANVLIAEDGHPQLIDFGIAYDMRTVEAGQLVIGGTRPYCSPEQLASVMRASVEYDHRTDLYALGVVGYELLTGRLPFAPNYDPSDEAVERDRASRFIPPPSPRILNPKVPPAVAAILSKCLAPNPTDRYSSAEELIDDLDRQLSRRPLRYAQNPSRGELFAKWAYRNRWGLAATVALGLVGSGYAGFAVHSAQQQERLMVAEALERADGVEREVRATRLALATPSDPSTVEAGLKAGENLLAAWGVKNESRWWESAAVEKLAGGRVDRLRIQATELLLDMSRVAAARAKSGTTAEQDNWRAKAKEWNRLAETSYPGERPPSGVWTQREWLCRMAGDDVGAKTANIAATSPSSATDFRTAGRERLEQNRWREAGELLLRATELDPSNFWGWFDLGTACYRRGLDRDAITAFDFCLALDPAAIPALFHRGQALLRAGELQRAEEDFNRLLELRPNWAEAYLNRASAREADKKYVDAAADLTKAIELGYPPTAVLLVRSRVYSRLGQPDFAKRDLTAGLEKSPTDEKGWITHGVHRMPKDGKGGIKSFAAALADFDRALVLNPTSISALQCKARCYSMAGENATAATVLTELLAVYPEWLDALSGRAVLYARLGERTKAHADAEAAERLGAWRPATMYQLAGVYAMTSKTDPNDKREAFRLLASALREGFGHDLLDIDRDLDYIRQEAEFSSVVEDAKSKFERRQKE